jgi:hypothetical protein
MQNTSGQWASDLNTVTETTDDLKISQFFGQKHGAQSYENSDPEASPILKGSYLIYLITKLTW